MFMTLLNSQLIPDESLSLSLLPSCRDHQQALADRLSLSNQLAGSQDELPVRRMKDSYIEVHLPLGTDPTLREKYLNYHKGVR